MISWNSDIQWCEIYWFLKKKAKRYIFAISWVYNGYHFTEIGNFLFIANYEKIMKEVKATL